MSAQQPQLTERAQKALADRDRAYRRYRKIKNAELKELLATDRYGRQLTEFIAGLKTFGADDNEAYLEYIYQTKARWIGQAPQHIRNAAMSYAARQVLEIRIAAGKLPFDDPLPGSDDDVYQILRQVFEPN